jgi:hypothetical protein
VYSGNGQLLKTLPLRPGPNTIDLSSLPNGSYVLKTGSLVRRVVVQH